MVPRRLLPVADDAQTWALARELLRPHRRSVLLTALTLLAGTGFSLLAAPLLGRIVDRIVAGQDVAAITAPVLPLALIAIGHGVATAIGTGMVARLGEFVLAELRERFVRKALALPQASLEAAGAGDLTARAGRDVAAVAETARYALPVLIRSALTIGLTLVALAFLDWRFLLAALVAVPIQVHTVRWYTRTASPVYAAGRIAIGAQQQQLLETYGGADTVRAFDLQASHETLVRERSEQAVGLGLHGVNLMSRFFSRLNLAEFVALAGLLALACFLIPEGLTTAGTATAAALYLHNLFNPINAALSLADSVQIARAGLRRLAGIATLPPTRASAAQAPSADSAITVKGISFGYLSSHRVLHDLNLRVEPGERVALVGTSGAGKTTLAALIRGIHQPDEGTVEVGAAALISQEVHVFAGSLRDDLRLSKPDASDVELAEALGRVGAASWVSSLPEGLDTVVGDGGHRLSAAQAQQLALARLILADPPVAILDEATADAGSANARELERAAAEALRGRTALIVAHRLSQAEAADRVILLDRGTIVEEGRHKDLLASGGRYARLWEAWSRQRHDAA